MESKGNNEAVLESLQARGLAGEPMRLPTALCSCGCTEPHVIAKRTCIDGLIVEFWSDGDVTCVLGRGLRGLGSARSVYAARANLRANRAVMGDACILTRDQLVTAIKLGRKLARQSGWSADALRRRVIDVALRGAA